MKQLWVLALCFGSLSARADDYLPFKMLSNAAQPFPFYVDSRSNRPAGVDYTVMQNTVERAWASWNAVQCATVKTRSLGPSGGAVPNPVSTIDSASVAPIWMLTNDADAKELFGYAGFIVGITMPRAYAGVLQTCDTYFNAFNTQWSTDPVTPADTMDLETVALHEAGHCLGLGHFVPYDAVMDQVVSPGESVRVLTPTDVTMLCNRYPLPGASGAACLGDGGCLTGTDKCLLQPTTGGLTLKLCTAGCAVNTNANCDVPFTCQSSMAFAGYTGACLLPGSAVTEVGKACVQNADCNNSFARCRPPEPAANGNTAWVDGYCTQSCEVGDPACPAGSTCVPLDTGLRCAQSCRVGFADCRAQYACAPIDAVGTTGVCIPRCYADTDCANTAAQGCRTCDGLCVDRQSIGAQIGDGCTRDADCGLGQSCRATDSTSTVKQCTQSCGRGCGMCPAGSICTPGTRGELFCLRECTGPLTCPAGLRCADTAVGKGCQPGCTGDNNCPVGQYCTLGECYAPETDAGCGSLCNLPDAGKPVIVIPKDAGTGSGGSGGCGCTSVDPALGLAALGLLSVLRRRRAWRGP